MNSQGLNGGIPTGYCYQFWVGWNSLDETKQGSFFGDFHNVPPYKDFGKKGIIVIFHSLNGQNEMR